MNIGEWTLDTVVNTDALSLLRGLPDSSVDAIITDPPYGTTELDFDQQPVNWTAFWLECKRVLARPSSPVVLFSQQPFTTDLINSNRAWWRMEIIYEKTMPVGYLNANRMVLRCHENIQVFSVEGADYYPVFETTTDTRALAKKRTGADHYNEHIGKDYHDTGRRYPRSVWRFAQRTSAFSNTVTLHPTEKPLLLMERLVLTFSEVGALVVDPFAGSGTTGFAAIKNGRRFVGSDNGVDTRTGRAWADLATERCRGAFTLPMFAGGS